MGNPHVLVIPYPSQGHVIPLMELSQLLTQQGLKITFVNTEFDHKRIINALAGDDNIIQNGINLVSITDGLDSVEERRKAGKTSEAVLQVMPGKVEELIKKMNGSDSEKLSCVIADQSISWALEIAEKHRIKRAAFCPAAAASLVLTFSIQKLIDDGIIDDDGTPTGNQIFKLSPTMPAMNTEQLMWASFGSKEVQKNIFKLINNNNRSVQLTEWLLCNTTYDLEPGALVLYPKILPIGPLPARIRHHDSAANFWAEDSACLDWLDQQQPQSVIYIAFGSITILNPIQIKELALGLELINRPFLWALGPNNRCPEGFEDRLSIHGKLVCWAPQQKVLSHPSIACFVSHCGWNSTIEGVSNGVPILCWPHFADQFINHAYICDIWKTGLGVKRDEKEIITRLEIRNKVDQILGNEEYKERALKLKEMVMSSIKEGGGSYNNFENFVKWLKE